MSIITGLHPDEPTGEIVKVALAATGHKTGMPFAVVPCCVFANLFPERRLRSGRPVRNTNDLVGWVMEQCHGPMTAVAHSTRLPFAGRNHLVYTLPKAAQAS